VQVLSGTVRDAGEIESTIEAVARTPNAGLIITGGIPINDRRKLIFAMAARYRLPAVSISTDSSPPTAAFCLTCRTLSICTDAPPLTSTASSRVKSPAI
jgi:hypothetical protein